MRRENANYYWLSTSNNNLLQDSGVYSTFRQLTSEWGGVFTFNPTSGTLVAPLTIKASLPFGSSLTFAVNTLGGTTIDSGSVFP